MSHPAAPVCSEGAPTMADAGADEDYDAPAEAADRWPPMPKCKWRRRRWAACPNTGLRRCSDVLTPIGSSVRTGCPNTGLRRC